MEHYWVPHPELVWAPCWLHSVGVEGVEDLPAVLATDTGDLVELPPEQIGTLERADEQQLSGIEDICTLSTVNDAAVLHTVRVRYLRREVYTRVSRMLIAVNPFAPLPIYSPKHLDEYGSVADSLELPPHIFGIASDALRNLAEEQRNQAVIISGESGAGKTESAKLVMSFIAEFRRKTRPRSVSKDNDLSSIGVDEQVLRTNPVLEAFGNAMTVRNFNSSRFGKWLDFHFSNDLSLQGCSIEHFLFEATRVCRQAPGERSYHIFFQLLHARDSPELRDLCLDAPTAYTFLKNGELYAPGIDDVASFADMKEALSTLDFGTDLQAQIFRVVAAVLTLGNCDFHEFNESAQLVNTAPALRAAELLQIDKDELLRGMLFRQLSIGGDITETPLRQDQARNVRDGLGKLLYELLFRWLVDRINTTLSDIGHQSSPAPSRLLGILDLAGFERFEHNSLEQLLINLSNEHIQQHFNTFVLKAELEEYEREGVVLEGFRSLDSSDCLALMDGKGGVLDILDENLALPKATDLTFVARVLGAHAGHAKLIAPKFKHSALSFGVVHYAGVVTYHCEGFLAKNADKLADDAAQLLASSSMDLMRELAPLLEADEELSRASSMRTVSLKRSPSAHKRTVRTATSKFRTSLRALMEKLSTASPRFVRCVKPNQERRPGVFDARIISEQLLRCGVVEAVRIRQQGFTLRLPIRRFLTTYRCIILHRGSAKKSSDLASFGWKPTNDGFEHAKLQVRALLEQLHEVLGQIEGNCIVGISKVLCKTVAQTALDVARSRAILYFVSKIQFVIRRWRLRRHARLAIAHRADIQDWLSRYDDQPDGTAMNGGLSTEQPQRGVAKRIGYIGSPDNLQYDTISELLHALARRLQELGHQLYVGPPNSALVRDGAVVQDMNEAAIDMFDIVLITPGGPGASFEAQRFEGQAELFTFVNSSDERFGSPNWMKSLNSSCKFDFQTCSVDEVVQAVGNRIKQDGGAEKHKEALEEYDNLMAQSQGVVMRELIEDLLARVESVRVRLIAELETAEQVDKLSNSIDPVAIDIVVARAMHLKLPDHVRMQLRCLEDRARALRVQLPLYQALQNAMQTSDLSEINIPQLRELLAEVEQGVGLVVHGEDVCGEGENQGDDKTIKLWLPELDGSSMVNEALRLCKLADEAVAKSDATDGTEEASTGARSRADTARSSIPESRRSVHEGRPSLKKGSFHEKRPSLKVSIVLPTPSETIIVPSPSDQSETGADMEVRPSIPPRRTSRPSISSLVGSDFGSNASMSSRRRSHKGSISSRSSLRRSNTASDIFDRTDSMSSSRSVSRRRATITGLTAENQTELLKNLAQASDEMDAVALEQLLREAVRHGIPHAELEGATSTLHRLQGVQFLVTAAEETKQAVEGDNTPTVPMLRRLQNLSHQLRVVHGDLEIARSAMYTLQRGAIARATIEGSDITEPKDTHLNELFNDLGNFSQLKPVGSWKGHAGSGFLSNSCYIGRDSMLSHSKFAIREAITSVRVRREEAAVQNFRNILVCMGDKPAPEWQRLAARRDILELAKTDAELRDEIYVQIMKQLSGNLSARSSLLGWQLLADVCQNTPASEELGEFLKPFLLAVVSSPASEEETQEKQATTGESKAAAVNSTILSEVKPLVQQCLSVIAKREKAKLDAEGGLADDADAQSYGVEHGLVGVVVHLIDGSFRHVYAPVRSSIGQLSAQAGQKFGVKHWKDFGFFQSTDGDDGDPPRLLPDNILVSDLCSRWQQLKEATGRVGRLLWKRRFLRPGEVLLPGDPLHAALSYRQALLEHLNFPVAVGDDEELFQRIGAAILCAEFDGVTSRLRERGFLALLLPAFYFKSLESRKSKEKDFLCDVVHEFSKKLRTELGPQVHRFQRMSRVFNLMQNTRQFGSHVWPARVMAAPTPDQSALSEPPTRTLQLVSSRGYTSSEQDVYVFVNSAGVHIHVAYHGAFSNARQRVWSFGFREEVRLGATSGRGRPTLVATSQVGQSFGDLGDDDTPGERTISNQLASYGSPHHGYEKSPWAGGQLLRWGARPGILQLVVHVPSADRFAPFLVTLACANALDVAYIIHRALSEDIPKPPAILGGDIHAGNTPIHSSEGFTSPRRVGMRETVKAVFGSYFTKGRATTMTPTSAGANVTPTGAAGGAYMTPRTTPHMTPTTTEHEGNSSRPFRI